MRQSDLDSEMESLGRDRQRRRVEDAQRKRKESWTSYGQRLVSAAVKPVGDALVLEWDASPTGKARLLGRGFDLLRERIDPYVAAFIATQVVFDSISARSKASSTFIAVGRQVEWEIIASSWSKRTPHLLKRLRRAYWDETSAKKLLTKARNRSEILEEGIRLVKGEDAWRSLWTDSEALRVGHCLVELLRRTTGLIDLVTLRSSARRTDTYVVPTDETEAYIRKVRARTEAIEPVFMPMVVPPYDWKTPWDGGYNLPGVGQPLVKTDRGNVADQMTREQMPEVYSAINYLQGVPYSINQKVLAVYQWAWDEGIPIGDLPLSSDIPVPPLPPMPEDRNVKSEAHRAAMREWWLVAGPIKKRNVEARSRRIHYARLKHLAEKFANTNIFFPMSCDFRGRLYTQPTFLTYQGCDAAKALVQFGFGKPITTDVGRKWLKVQGANSWGVKGTFADRVAWVESHRDRILAAARDPIADPWWREADEPWQFLAFCFEVAAIVKDPRHPSRLVCWQDGTNNGLQVLSLAFRDNVGGRATNCLDSGRPMDIYQDVADRTIEILRAEQDEARREWAREWLAFGVDRSTTKRIVMIVPYSGTLYSAVKYVKSWFHERVTPGRPSPWRDATKPIGYLTRRIWDAIGDVVVKARDSMDWLRRVGEQCIAEDVDPTWVSPTGFIVAQDYPDYGKATVRTTVLHRTTMWQIREKLATRNKRKHMDAISPNWVHSLDAAGLVRTANRIKAAGIDSMASLHDCVGVHAEDGDVLSRELRVAWSSMFSEDVVGGLVRCIQPRLRQRLPEPPSFGSLDPAKLLDSPYFFS